MIKIMEEKNLILEQQLEICDSKNKFAAMLCEVVTSYDQAVDLKNEIIDRFNRLIDESSCRLGVADRDAIQSKNTLLARCDEHIGKIKSHIELLKNEL
jgi:hypothetical protein